MHLPCILGRVVCLCFAPGTCLPPVLWVPLAMWLWPLLPWLLGPHCHPVAMPLLVLVSCTTSPWTLPSRKNPPLHPRDSGCRISLPFPTQNSHKVGHESTQQCFPPVGFVCSLKFHMCSLSSPQRTVHMMCVCVCMCWGRGGSSAPPQALTGPRSHGELFENLLVSIPRHTVFTEGCVAQFATLYWPAGLPWWLRGKKKKICLPMQETWVQSLSWKDPPEKEMTTHSIILAWEIPWTEEPGRLQFIESQRVRHNLVTRTTTAHLLWPSHPKYWILPSMCRWQMLAEVWAVRGNSAFWLLRVSCKTCLWWTHVDTVCAEYPWTLAWTLWKKSHCHCLLFTFLYGSNLL